MATSSASSSPSPPASRGASPSLRISTVFTATPPASPSKYFHMGCPLQTPNCSCDGVLGIVQHLIVEHRAKHYDVVFDEDGVADIRFETVLSLTESVARRTAILLTLPTGEVMCWSMETKRRADGELQASTSIQIVHRPFPKPTPTTRRETEDLFFSSSRRSSNSDERTSPNEKRKDAVRRISDPFSPDTVVITADDDSSPHLQKQQGVEVLYHATITANGDTEEESSSSSSDKNKNKDAHQQWNGVLSASRPCCPHEHLISHGGALISLYPTNHSSFIAETRTQPDGNRGTVLRFPICLRIETIAKFKRITSSQLSFFLPPPLLINEK